MNNNTLVKMLILEISVCDDVDIERVLSIILDILNSNECDNIKDEIFNLVNNPELIYSFFK